MEKAFDHKLWEKKIYKKWESADVFAPKGDEAYTILMPPPNANASLHAGHAMYTVDDILIRYKRMKGYAAEWIPGLDHAGFETQFVYEKHLAKQKKSRMDFDRKTLYSDIFKFVEDNSGLIFEQFKRLGFSPNWERSVFTLDENVVSTVYSTFKKMHKEGLVYRDDYIVNYCTHDGTSLAELEVKHIERTDPLYYVKYKLADEDGYIVVATVRVEPIFIDTHLAVNPKDKKNNKLIGKFVLNPLTDVRMEIIGDEYVDPEFGTGIVKLTPAHDPNDFEVAKKHKLPIRSAINLRGKITNKGGELAGLSVRDARKKAQEILEKKGLLEKVDQNYLHSVSTCYKCGRDLEPMVVPNWFIKVDPLKKPVIEAVKKDKTKFTPKRYKKQILDWLELMHDWPISRQIVWGIRIPVWYNIEDPEPYTVSFIDKRKIHKFGKLVDILKDHSLEEIKEGLQSLIASSGALYKIGEKSPGENYLPETDTFDTWFSSGQWPIVTHPSNYPTDMMGTLSDILKSWISRMMMFGIYLKGDVPFRDVYLWAMVADAKGVKMSKSKGNVINPIELVDKYGADALRMSLVFGSASGNKIIIAEEKVRAMRNFANKVWNVARFVHMDRAKFQNSKNNEQTLNSDDRWILNELDKAVNIVSKSLDEYKFNIASEALYEFIWHNFADIYIEKIKDRRDEAQGVLVEVLEKSLKLLHPFMPFVTEAIWSINFEGQLALAEWPEGKTQQN